MRVILPTNQLSGHAGAVHTAAGFLTELKQHPAVGMVFLVTDDDRAFQTTCSRLPDGVEPVRLYESYLTNFSFATGQE